jgi:dTDP-4-dehydrorhamnose 3,5-epimerase
MPFTFTQTELAGVMLVKPKIFSDERGYFAEMFKAADFQRNGILSNFVQDNYSYSKEGVLRGLHYQSSPKAQGKFIYVLSGSIFDVVVDVRLNSPSYGRWISIELSAENHHMLWIPPGLAHGFCVLSAGAGIMYRCTEYYDPGTERGISWNDPTLNIPWPIKNPIISEKDTLNPDFLKITSADLLEFSA